MEIDETAHTTFIDLVRKPQTPLRLFYLIRIYVTRLLHPTMNCTLTHAKQTNKYI